MPLVDLIKEIQAKKAKAIADRLKKEKPNQKYVPNAKEPAVHHTPLHEAVQICDPAVVDALLAGGADVTGVDSANNTPLHWAARSSSKEAADIAGALLMKKAAVNALNKDSESPLHIAAAHAALPVLAVLLKASGTSLETAAQGHQAVHAALQGRGGAEPAAQMAALHALEAAGASLIAKDSQGRTPLLLLLAAGRSEDALSLVQGSSDVGVSLADASGLTPLHHAVSASTPSLELVKALIAKGASADTQAGPDKDTALTLAIQQGKLPLAMVLASAAKKPGLRNAKKDNALSLALALPAAESLPGKGDGSYTVSGEGLVCTLLAGPGGAELAAEGGKALLQQALEGKKDAVVAELVKLCKQPVLTTLDLDFKSLIHMGLGAAAMAYLQRFDEEHAGDVAVDDQGNTYLHVAAEMGAAPEVIRAFVAKGLNPNTANKESDTPLHVACRSGNAETCRALFECGSDPLRRNGKNRLPGSQLKLSDAVKAYMGEAEDAAKAAKAAKQSELWDEKMKATLTESACVIRGL